MADLDNKYLDYDGLVRLVDHFKQYALENGSMSKCTTQDILNLFYTYSDTEYTDEQLAGINYRLEEIIG